MSKIYIGITGVARSGKNLLANIISKQLKDTRNLSVGTYALADELKRDCADSIKQKFNIDVFTEIAEEKNVIRPLLVWYGCQKRSDSCGRFWIDLLTKKIQDDKHDVVIVTDIRFAEYVMDEHYWIKKELKGKLIHVSRYNEANVIVPPANETEKIYDVKMREHADYHIVWKNSTTPNPLDDVVLNEHVSKCLNTILK